MCIRDRLWEKRTSSWSSYPRARRTTSRAKTPDGRLSTVDRRWHLDAARGFVDRCFPGHSDPETIDPVARPSICGGAGEQAHRCRAGPDPRSCELARIRRLTADPNLCAPARPGHICGVDLNDLPGADREQTGHGT